MTTLVILNEEMNKIMKTALRKQCPNTEIFPVGIFVYWTEYRKIRTRKNSIFGHFSRSVVKSLEKAGLLIKGVRKTIKNEGKEKQTDTSVCY